MDALDVHSRLATALLLYLVVLGVWGIALGLTGSGPSPSYRGALVIVEGVILVQGLLGVVSWATRAAPDGMHVLYGLALALAIPLVAVVSREGSPRRTALMLGLASLFAAGLVTRGMATA